MGKGQKDKSLTEQTISKQLSSFLPKGKQSLKPYKAFVPTQCDCSCWVSLFILHVSYVFSLLFTGAMLYACCENEKEMVTIGYVNPATGGGCV